MKIGKLFCSLVVASSAGLVIGLLFAPENGSQTRRRIRQKVEDFLEDEIIGYNQIVCDVKEKLDVILNGMTIPVNRVTNNWADNDQKNELIV